MNACEREEGDTTKHGWGERRVGKKEYGEGEEEEEGGGLRLLNEAFSVEGGWSGNEMKGKSGV